MKKATKSSTKKETKTKTKTTVKAAAKPKAKQKIKTSGESKAKKVTKTRTVPAGTSGTGIKSPAKPKPTLAAKPATRTVTAAKAKTAIKKTETRPPAKAKPVVRKKEAAKTAPTKSAAARPKAAAKTKIAKRPLKAAPVKKTPAKATVKSPAKKVVGPEKKPVALTKNKAVSAKKPAATAASTKKKAVASLPKKAPQPTPAKAAVQTAAPSKKPKVSPVKTLIKPAGKPTTVTAKATKLPLKKIVPAQPPARTTRELKPGKPLAAIRPGPKSATAIGAVKPKEKPVKKVVKKTPKPMAEASEKPAATKRTSTPGEPKEPARIRQVKAVSQAVPAAKKNRIAAPPVPEAALEAEEELLSVAEIEAREGRIIKPRLKIFLPREEIRDEAGEEALADTGNIAGTGREALPQEYGESEFFLIVIDPTLIFLDWEIIPGDLPSSGLPLCVRIYDVTGIVFDGNNAHGFIDIDLVGLTGSGYCEIGMQGKEIVAEIGFIDAQGLFIALMRSGRASVPPLLQYDDLGIVRKMQEAGLPVGY